MLTLYIKNGCAYCAMVLAKIDDLGLDVELRNVADDGVYEEMEEKGGKRQEPYLVDDGKGISMYESFAINNYLDENYGNGKKSGGGDSSESKAPDVCPI